MRVRDFVLNSTFNNIELRKFDFDTEYGMKPANRMEIKQTDSNKIREYLQVLKPTVHRAAQQVVITATHKCRHNCQGRRQAEMADNHAWCAQVKCVICTR